MASAVRGTSPAEASVNPRIAREEEQKKAAEGVDGRIAACKARVKTAEDGFREQSDLFNIVNEIFATDFTPEERDNPDWQSIHHDVQTVFTTALDELVAACTALKIAESDSDHPVAQKPKRQRDDAAEVRAPKKTTEERPADHLHLVLRRHP